MGRAREEEKREGDKRQPRGQREPREDQEPGECVAKMAGFHKKKEAGGRKAKKARAEMFRVGNRPGEVLRNQDSATVCSESLQAGVCLDMVYRHLG